MSVNLVQIAASITVLGAAIYVIGLIALCWPIFRSLTSDASTAMYAASLVPRTVVAGQGVRIFVGFPLIAALCLITVVSVPRIQLKILEWVSMPLEEGHWLHQVILALTATLIAVFFIWSVKRLRAEGLFDFFFAPLTNPNASPFGLFSIALSAIGGAIGGWLILTAEQVGWETIFLALVFFFGAIALSSVPDAVSIDPPLPKVNVITTKAGESEEYEGRLLTHSEGHWYIFDEKKKFLRMVPDDNVEVVCIDVR